MKTVAIDDYDQLSKVSDPRLSPDGEQILFLKRDVVSDRAYENVLHIGSVNEKPKPYTPEGNVVREPRWSPDGDRIAFVSDRSGSSELWVLPVDGGAPTQVTTVVGDVHTIRWSPSGDYVAFVQSVSETERGEGLDRGCPGDHSRSEPDPREITRLVYRSSGGYFDGRRDHIYIVDTESGEVTPASTEPFDHSDPSWGESGALYYTRWRDEVELYHDIVRYDAVKSEEKIVTESHHWWDDAGNIAVSGDGKIAHVYIPDEGPTPLLNQTQIRVFDGETERTVTTNIDRMIAGGPYWGPDDEYVYFLVPDRGEVSLKRVRYDGTNPENVLAGHGHHIHDVDVGENRIAFTQSTWRHPGDVYLHDTRSEETKRVTNVNEAYLDDVHVGEPEEVWIEHDGTTIQGWVLHPPEIDEEEEYPMVLEIHGGPTLMRSRSGTMWHEFQALAASGYVVVWTNPRGSSGYGEQHARAIAEEFRPDFDDLMEATDEISSRPYIDDDQLFVTGGSFGGFLTGWVVGHTDRFAGAVAQRGLYDQSAQYGTKDTFHSSESRLGKPWENPERFWENSPVAYVDEVTTPTLLIHSENDSRCSIFNAEIFYRYLKRTGVETEFVRYPRETHDLSRSGEPAHIVDRIQRIRSWFDEHADQSPDEDTG
jgi:dipeptidyl aminopeptidase/acylaminoacyl peptidase